MALKGGGLAGVGEGHLRGRVMVWRPKDGPAREVARHTGGVRHLVEMENDGLAWGGRGHVMVWRPGQDEAEPIPRECGDLSALIALPRGGVAFTGHTKSMIVWDATARSVMEYPVGERVRHLASIDRGHHLAIVLNSGELVILALEPDASRLRDR